MNQTDSGHYDGKSGEQVTLTIEAHGIAENLAVSLNGNALSPTSSGPATYVFSASAASDADFVDIECHFSSGDPDNAYYQFYVKGSQGGGTFNASSIRKKDSDWEAVLQFTLS